MTDRLKNIKDVRLTQGAGLAAMTSFRIGGPCRLLAEPQTPEAAIELMRVLPECGLPYTVLGNGSNTLCADEGYDGVIVRPAPIRGVERLFGDRIRAGAGLSVPALACFARDEGLSGLAFAQGIPGALGGALCMNAGAYGGSLGACLESAVCVYPGGTVRTYSSQECRFGYRESIFRSAPCLILEAIFALEAGERERIAEDMRGFSERRAASQPLSQPSAGSVFKRPPGHFAGKLIEDCGLKGYAVGGACVSPKHAGFIVNRGGATARDVLELIRHIQSTVYGRFGVQLEREICLLGIEE